MDAIKINFDNSARAELIDAIRNEFGSDPKYCDHFVNAANSVSLGIMVLDFDESDINDELSLNANESVQLSLSYFGFDNMFAI